MGKFDDPRVLEATITKLQQDLAHLKKATLPLASQQRGPLPGYTRAVQIGDANQKGAMWLSLAGNIPGQAPYQAVTDSNGTVRVELGNLAANGVSPAQFGLRASDSAGLPLFDSLGVIGPMTPLAQQTSGVLNQQIVGPATNATINSSSVTFSVPRQLRVLTIYTAIFSTVAGSSTASFGYVNARMDSSDSGANNHHFMLVSGASNASDMGFNPRIDTLSAGNHTADIVCDVDNNATVQVYKTGLYVFQLGS